MPIPKRKNPKSSAISFYDTSTDTYPDVSQSTPIPVISASGLLAVKIIDAGSGITYIGIAATGSATSDAVWQIRKMDESVSGITTIKSADGNGNFDNIMDDYASYTYS